jgi:RNA polymerase sigma-70 factor (ECF subfamily)
VPQEVAFRELIRRVRAGEQEAAAELVRRYQPVIERAVRLPLVSLRLHRVLESRDICQSVLANFFARVLAGRFDLDEPEQLARLLVSMARNQVTDEARKHHAGRRDNRRLEAAPPGGGLDLLEDRGPTPSKIVAGHELIQEVYRRLSADERALAEQRALGHDWATIAAARGGNPDALRKKLSRAVDRVARQLGLGEMHLV